MKYRDVDIELTKEQEETFRRFVPISNQQEFDYTPQVLRILPEDKRPVFRLCELNGIDRYELQDAARRATTEDGKPLVNGEYVRGVISRGLVGWKNFFAQDGSEVVYDAANVYGVLGTSLLLDLTAAIMNRGTLSQEEQLGLR